MQEFASPNTKGGTAALAALPLLFNGSQPLLFAEQALGHVHHIVNRASVTI